MSLMSEDPHGDKAWLRDKARRRASIDPTPPLTPLPLEHLVERPLTPAERARKPIEKKHVKYRYIDGSTERISARMLRAIEMAHIERKTKPEIMAELGISRAAVYQALSTPKALRVNQDMLARIKSGALLHAWSGLLDLGREGTKEDGVKLGAHNSVIDRLEGKAIQRSIQVSEHTETVRFIVAADAPPPKAIAMVKDPETGRYVTGEGAITAEKAQ